MNRAVLLSNTIISHRLFNIVLFILIFLSALLIGLETYPQVLLEYGKSLLLIDRIIIGIFGIEIILKLIARGNRPWLYFSDPWNVFDFIIVVICLIPVGDTHFFAVFRILRVLRIFRMITVLPKLKLIISALLKSIPSMGYVIMLIGILFYVYAIIGVFAFGSTDRLHFGDLHHTFITLFKVLTLEGWTDIMNLHILGGVDPEAQQIVSFWPFLYFSSFILIGAMIIMNLFIGVIMNSMEESQRELALEIRSEKNTDNDQDERFNQIVSRLDALKEEILSLKKDTHPKN